MQNTSRRLFRNLKLKHVSGRHAYSTQPLHDVGQPSASTHPYLVKEKELTPGITTKEYISRRKALLKLLPKNSLAICSASPVKMMTDMVPYPFRQDADYLYLTGCQQPGGIAVLGHDYGLCLFMPDAVPNVAMWEGQTAGVDEAIDIFKADEAFPIRKIEKILPHMIKKSSKLFHNRSTAIPTYTALEDFQKSLHTEKVNDLSILTHELRLIKSPAEVELMRNSASIACQGLLQTMLNSRSFPHEAQLSAKIEFECRMRGADRMAFNPVVGGGKNATVIHYSRKDQKIHDNDLVLLDVGCELHGYVSDLTRTWPPCGSFSSAQEELYSLILETNKECLKLCKPGTSISQIHKHSIEMLRRGFKEIGILSSDLTSRYNQLNPTNIGHYLGMDVHDCSNITYERPLKPGVVITVEPGVYIPSSLDCPQKYRGIGIRVEDEVLITESGFEVLTASVPKEIEHIESLLNNYNHEIEMENNCNILEAAAAFSS